MFFDRVKYDATQVSDTLFNVTLSTGFEELPSTATRASLYAIDTAGNFAHIDGYRVGGQIFVNFIYDSSEVDETMPTFGSGLIIYSTVGGKNLTNGLGRGAIVPIGQSNGVGYEENSVGLLDFTDSRILQWSASENAVILASDPLEHPDSGIRANSVGMSMTFAKDLLRNEYHNQIVIIPHCEGSTGFWEGQWVQGGARYNGALALVNAFLAENPNNYIIAIVWSLGEDDAIAMDRANAFQASFDLATANFRADIVGNTAQPDASRVPVLCTQMSPGWNINTSVPIVRAALADTPNRILYSGHVDSTGATFLSEFSNIHFDGDGCRLMGSRMYAALQLARGNAELPTGITGTLVETLDDFTSAASGNVVSSGIAGSVNETLDDFTSTASGNVALNITGTVNETLDNFTSTASGNVEEAITGSVNETLGDFTSTASGNVPLPIQVEFNRGVGQTTGATLTWANQGALGSSHDAVQSTAANQPTFDGSGNVVFDGTDDYLTIPGDVLNDSSGYSIMVRFQRNGNFQSLVGSDSLVDAVARLYMVTNPLTATSNDSPILNGSTTISNATWYKAYITVDSSNNQTLYVNGVSDGSSTGGTKSTSYTTAFIGSQEGVVWPLNGMISDLIIQPTSMSLAEMDAATAGW